MRQTPLRFISQRSAAVATEHAINKHYVRYLLRRTYADTAENSDHITELNSARPKQPFFFLKPTSSILLPGAGPVIRPKGVDLHFEVELALIIGKQLRDLQASDEQGALDAIESERTPLSPTLLT